MKYLTIIFSLFILSCQSEKSDALKSLTDSSKNETTFPKVNEEFTLYLNNFKKTKLPIVIKGCLITSEGLKRFDNNNFIKYTGEQSVAYGQIPTNGTFVATITLGEADCYLPILTTYRLNGTIIDRKEIKIGGCGGDCGFDCEEYMTLKSDYTFYASDTISTFDCDSLGQEIPGTYKYYVIHLTGKLLPSGVIEMTDEIEKELTGRKTSHKTVFKEN